MRRYFMKPTDNSDRPEQARPAFGQPAGPSNAPGAPLPPNIYPNPQGTPPPTNPTPAAAPTPTPAPPNTYQTEPSEREHWHSIASTALIFLLAPLLALMMAAFVIQSYQVDGQSMETTLQDRDRLIVDKLPRTWARLTGHAYIPHRGDIIIFNQNLANFGQGEDKQLIKRVIGLPGERVVVRDGAITVFNQAHPSGFNPDKSAGYHIAAVSTSGDLQVDLHKNEIFVCGDNRPNSEDSRYFGPVPASHIVGKLALRLVPLDKIQKF